MKTWGYIDTLPFVSVPFFVEFLNLMKPLMTKDVVSLFSKGTSRKNGSYCMGY